MRVAELAGKGLSVLGKLVPASANLNIYNLEVKRKRIKKLENVKN
jgi:hypothetical protein